MKFLKRLINCVSFGCLVALTMTGNKMYAIPLLMFSSASAGIMIGEKIEK